MSQFLSWLYIQALSKFVRKFVLENKTSKHLNFGKLSLDKDTIEELEIALKLKEEELAK